MKFQVKSTSKKIIYNTLTNKLFVIESHRFDGSSYLSSDFGKYIQ
jgi:hypothetical protein